MKNFSTHWEMEDTFFGAILGAFLGTFIENLPTEYIALIILFFILFPMTLRKAGYLSPYAIVVPIIFNTLWIVLLVYDLDSQGIVELNKGSILIIIFLGWLASLAVRTLSTEK